MGLLKHVLFWPVTGPMFLTRFSMDKVLGAVREELTDDASVKSELMELQLQLELGDIDDDEYVRREGQLMRRLREIREWRERFGMGVSGGLVRVQQEAIDEAEEELPTEPEPPDVKVAKPSGAEVDFYLGFE